MTLKTIGITPLTRKQRKQARGSNVARRAKLKACNGKSRNHNSMPSQARI